MLFVGVLDEQFKWNTEDKEYPEGKELVKMTML